MLNKTHTVYKYNENNPLIIFIHGFATTSNYFLNFYKKYLEEEFNLITIELPKMGINNDELDHFNVLNYAIYVINLIKQNHWKDFILIGHSMGAGICEIICNKIPNLIKKCILLCPMNSSFSLKLLNTRKLLKKDTLKKEEETLKYLFYQQNHYFINDMAKQIYVRSMHNYKVKNNYYIKKVYKSFFSLKLKKLLHNAEVNNHINTLIVLSKNDMFIDFIKANKKLKKNHNFKILSIKECGHMPFLEQPDITSKFILEFLNDKKESTE